ncbi:UNVERIFIED_CONTAM: hypothetical protein Sradi_4391600 [Sesamum radiatum]|uniref:Uncharacterized protein n=1 Tax=Sesamum radiatum TaxID=300843 RepID=A0AAW2NQT2_SESRA
MLYAYGGVYFAFITTAPGFINLVQGVWRYDIHGTLMYAITCELKALKPVFRAKRKEKGDLSDNVSKAKQFLNTVKRLLSVDRHSDLLLTLERVAKLVLQKASKLELSMLQQRAKIQWLKGGDQCSKIFFRKVAVRRASLKVFQITNG